jgi:hypothetical protein
MAEIRTGDLPNKSQKLCWRDGINSREKKTSGRIFGVVAEIRTGDLPNTSQKL